MKECLRPSLESWEVWETSQRVKSEFGFDTVATISRSVAKLLFELLNPISSNEGDHLFLSGSLPGFLTLKI